MQKAAFRITDDLPNTEVYCTLTTTPTQRTLGGASLTTKSTSSPFVKSSLMRPTTQTHTFYPEGARPESSGKVQELGRRTGWGLRSFERNVQGRSTSLSRGGSLWLLQLKYLGRGFVAINNVTCNSGKAHIYTLRYPSNIVNTLPLSDDRVMTPSFSISLSHFQLLSESSSVKTTSLRVALRNKLPGGPWVRCLLDRTMSLRSCKLIVESSNSRLLRVGHIPKGLSWM